MPNILNSQISNAIAGEVITSPAWVYYSTTKYYNADADDAAKAATALCFFDAVADDDIQVYFTGMVLDWPGGGLSPGATYYLSSTPGEMSTAKPSGYFQEVGYAVSADVFCIKIGPRIIERFPTAKTQVGDANSSSTTEADVPGMSISLEANKKYRVEFYGIFQSSATTTGGRFTLTFSGTGTPIGAWNGLITNATAANNLVAPVVFGTDFVTTGVQAINTNHIVMCTFFINPTVGGDIQLQFGSEVAASSDILLAGSSFVLTEV